MENYFIALAAFCTLFAFSRIADKWLQEKEDRRFRELVDGILNNEYEDVPTSEQIYSEMQVVKEALMQAYEMEDTQRVKTLGKYLNQLRAIKYN